jgi:Mrp family chromosome partitioning ATPase
VNLLETLRRGWRLLLVIAIPIALGVGLYTQSLANQYTATSVISFAPRPNSNVGADVVGIVVPKYQVYVTSDAQVSAAARSLGVSESQLSGDLDASIATNTSNLQITVQGSSPSFAAHAVNQLATATQQFSRSDPLLVGTVVARAEAPTSPSGPNRHLLEAAGLVVALLVAVGIVLLTDRVRPVVRTATDASEAAQSRIVGILPRARAIRGGLDALNNRKVGPAVRNLRTQLDRSTWRGPGAEHGPVLVITSALPSEGKTTVAFLLAMSSARVGHRVLLIDGDLVRPHLAGIFGVAPRPGVSQALRSETFDEVPYVRIDVRPRLTVMPTTPDPEAGDLITQNMERLLDGAARHYDLVIIDAPPVLGNDSGQKLATLADGTILVVGRGARVTLVEEAAATLRSLDAKIVGTVANGFRPPESRGYYA